MGVGGLIIQETTELRNNYIVNMPLSLSSLLSDRTMQMFRSDLPSSGENKKLAGTDVRLAAIEAIFESDWTVFIFVLQSYWAPVTLQPSHTLLGNLNLETSSIF